MTERTTVDGAVVVGFDGSASARHAVTCAADEAQRRNLPLVLVHAFTWPLIYPPLTAEHDLRDPGPRNRVRQLLTEAAEEIRASHPRLKVTSRIVDGHAGKVLSTASREAALLVVGHRGAGGFAGLLAGSVALHVTRHAHCPVVVARGAPAAPTAPVVVGVDGSDGARHAVRFAFATAAGRGAPLVVVYAGPADRPWPPDAVAHGYPPPGPDPVEASLDDCPQRYPGVAVETAVVRNQSPAAALITAATGAGLLVVGSRGGGGFSGLRLGSVGGALLDHAPCDLAVVPAAHSA
jgi:nucleotide-binding universal stress UspA family protein